MPVPVQFRKTLIFGMVAALLLGTGAHASDASPDAPDTRVSTALDHGFMGLYNLDFAGAQKDFSTWQAQHPEDPVGPVSEAAGYLFSEFNRLGVLEAQFYENDDAFAERAKRSADPAVRDRFQHALARAQNLARARLAKDPKDRDALFAMTL